MNTSQLALPPNMLYNTTPSQSTATIQSMVNKEQHIHVTQYGTKPSSFHNAACHG